MNIATDAGDRRRERRNGAQTAPSTNDENASTEEPDEEAIVIKDVSQFFC